MKFTIDRYTSADEQCWDDFISEANNGNIFHTRKFLSYHPPDRFEDHSLIFKKDNKVIALLPAIVHYDAHRKLLISHRGASYGGIVTKYHLNIKDAFSMIEKLLKHASEHEFKGIEITPPPQIYLSRPCDYIDFALVKNQFGYKKREISSVIPLTFSEEDILSTFSPESRRAVRRGIKLGVRVEESEAYDVFYSILNKNLKMRHNVQPTHTLDELLTLKNLFPDKIKLYAAYYEKQMIAGVVMFHCNPRVTLAFYISHDEAFQQYRGVNMLFYEIIKRSIRDKFAFLDFGIFTVNMDPNWGLGRFKESFGAQGVFRDSFLKYLD